MKINKTFRALVMGDVFRRLISRTLAQQLGAQLQEACAPFQYALTTRAGTEALARALRFATESHQSTTVVSVDGVGAYDHTSRSCMFQSLRDCPALPPLIPLSMAGTVRTSSMRNLARPTPYPRRKVANRATR